jgi:hypothetical protein
MGRFQLVASRHASNVELPFAIVSPLKKNFTAA